MNTETCKAELLTAAYMNSLHTTARNGGKATQHVSIPINPCPGLEGATYSPAEGHEVKISDS